MTSRLIALGVMTLVVGACSDAPTAATAFAPAALLLNEATSASVSDASPVSSVRWNRKAMALFRVRGGAAGRPNAYLSLAQYRAVLAANDAQHGTTRPSPAGAAWISVSRRTKPVSCTC